MGGMSSKGAVRQFPRAVASQQQQQQQQQIPRSAQPAQQLQQQQQQLRASAARPMEARSPEEDEQLKALSGLDQRASKNLAAIMGDLQTNAHQNIAPKFPASSNANAEHLNLLNRRAQLDAFAFPSAKMQAAANLPRIEPFTEKRLVELLSQHYNVASPFSTMPEAISEGTEKGAAAVPSNQRTPLEKLADPDYLQSLATKYNIAVNDLTNMLRYLSVPVFERSASGHFEARWPANPSPPTAAASGVSFPSPPSAEPALNNRQHQSNAQDRTPTVIVA